MPCHQVKGLIFHTYVKDSAKLITNRKKDLLIQAYGTAQVQRRTCMHKLICS